jgi:hypothetical protein
LAEESTKRRRIPTIRRVEKYIIRRKEEAQKEIISPSSEYRVAERKKVVRHSSSHRMRRHRELVDEIP